MKLISILNTGESALDRQVFRTSSLRDLIVFGVFSILFLACVGHYIWYSVSYSVGFWWNFAYLWFGFWFALFAWFAWSRFKASLLPSNWLVTAGPDRLLIKIRSFQNYYYPDIDPVVIELFWREIDSVRKTVENSIKPGSDGDVTDYFTYLDLKLRLSEKESKKIENALVNERNYKPLKSSVGELKHELFQARKRKAPKHEIGGIKHRLRNAKIIKYQQNKQSGSKHHDYPVRLLDDNVLRLRWNAIKPNIEKTLEYFAGYTQLEIDIHIKSDSTGDLKGQVLEDMILDRVVKGDKMDAITLVKKHYGFSTTDSIKFIGELMDNVSNLESDK